MLQWKEWVLLANCMKHHCKKETKAYLTFVHSLHQRYQNKSINVQTIKTIHRQEDAHPTHKDQLQCIRNECQTLIYKLILKLKEKIPIVIQELQSHKDTRLVKNLMDIQKKLESMKETRLTIDDVKKIINFKWELIK